MNTAQVELKFEYIFVIKLLAMINNEASAGISLNASRLAGMLQDEGLPVGISWSYPLDLAGDCIAVLKGSSCPRTVSGVRSALQVYRRGDSGIWLESWQY